MQILRFIHVFNSKIYMRDGTEISNITNNARRYSSLHFISYMLYFYSLIYSSTTLPDCFTYNFKSSPLLKQKSTAMTESWPKSTQGAEGTPQM